MDGRKRVKCMLQDNPSFQSICGMSRGYTFLYLSVRLPTGKTEPGRNARRIRHGKRVHHSEEQEGGATLLNGFIELKRSEGSR